MPDSGRTTLERGLASVVVGLVAAAVVIITLEPAVRSFYPIPEVGATLSPEQLSALPWVTFLLLWALYAAASLVGGLASTLIAGRVKSWPALMTGLVLMIAGTFIVLTVYQPLWFRLASFFTYPMSYLGYLAVRKPA